MRRMRRVLRGGLLGIGAVLLTLSPLPGVADNAVQAGRETAPEDSEPLSSFPVTAPDLGTMEAVAESESLILYLDRDTAETGVMVKGSGRLWTSNPSDAEESTDVRLRAQMILTYYNSSANEFTIDSYSESVAKEQFTVEPVQNGIKVTYTMGEQKNQYVFPTIISAARMEQFLSRLSEEDAGTIRKYYGLKSLKDCKTEKARQSMMETYRSISDSNDLYVARNLNRNKSVMERVTNLFAAAGYTLEDLEQDNEENYVSVDEEEEGFYFSIPLVYQLEGDRLKAYIPGSEIEYNPKYPLATISLLPFMGAAGTQDQGSMLVPDGSGALIHFNNGKLTSRAYIGSVYGKDYAFPEQMQTQDIDPVTLPVFGLSYEDRGIFAILTDGEAFADIVADISGRIYPYNTVYSRFRILPSQEVSLGDTLGTNRLMVFQEKPYSGNFQVQYAFLEGDGSYSAMARYYQRYLEETAGLTRKASADIPFVMGIVGAIDKTESFLGIPYNGEVSLTSFSQAQEMADRLLADGVKDLKVQYIGWLSGGVRQQAASSASAMSLLGGRKGFLSLADHARRSGFTLYPDVSFGYVWKDTLFDGFSNSRHASSALNGQKAGLYQYDLVTNEADLEKPWAYVVSPSHYAAMASAFGGKYKDYGLESLGVETLGSHLSSDQNKQCPVNRQEAQHLVTETLAALSGEYALMGTGANAYALPYMDTVVGIPTTSNRYTLFDETIPFVQMVLHGYTAYTGSAMNYSSTVTEDVLRSIETGSGLYVQWIYEDNALVKESNYAGYYAANWMSTYDRSLENYRQLCEALDGLGNVRIVSHRMLTSQVSETTYENGAQVLVNYGKSDYEADNVRVPAQGYAVTRNQDG